MTDPKHTNTDLRDVILSVDTVFVHGKNNITQFLAPNYYIDRLEQAINNYINGRVEQVLSQLKAPEGLLEAHKTYSNLSKLSSQFEHQGKIYASCHVCGFSPEAMNDEIDRIAKLNQVKGDNQDE